MSLPAASRRHRASSTERSAIDRPRATATAVWRPAGAYSSHRGRAEQAERRRPGGGGHVHQAGIVADEQGAAGQAAAASAGSARRRGRSRPAARRAPGRRAAVHAPRAGEHRRAGVRQRPGAAAGGRRRRSARRARPCRPSWRWARARPPAGPAAAGARRARGRRARSRRRAGAADRAPEWPPAARSCGPRRLRITARRRAGSSQASAEARMSTTRSQRVRDRRGPERRPVQAARPLLERDQPLQVRHVREQARGHRAAGDGDPALRVGADQVVEEAGRQHGVANPVGGHEQDTHGQGSA